MNIRHTRKTKLLAHGVGITRDYFDSIGECFAAHTFVIRFIST